MRGRWLFSNPVTFNFILAVLLTFIILTQQGIGVSLEQLETFLKEFPQTPMHHLLEMFENIVKLDITAIISCMENYRPTKGEQVSVMCSFTQS